MSECQPETRQLIFLIGPYKEHCWCIYVPPTDKLIAYCLLLRFCLLPDAVACNIKGLIGGRVLHDLRLNGSSFSSYSERISRAAAETWRVNRRRYSSSVAALQYRENATHAAPVYRIVNTSRQSTKKTVRRAKYKLDSPLHDILTNDINPPWFDPSAPRQRGDGASDYRGGGPPR